MSDNIKTFATEPTVDNSAAIVSFKRATVHDRAFLLNLRKASMDEHLKKAGICLNDAGHMQRIDEYFDDSYIILIQDVAIGLLKLGQFPDRIHIRQFQLLPKYHCVGIGSKVLELIKRKAKEKQLNISLNVLLDNPAKQLYLRHGFKVISVNELEFQMGWQYQAQST